MLGGYNIKPLIDLLDDAEVGADRRRGAEEDAADVRLLPRRQGKGRQGQRQRQGRAAELGRRRVVHRRARKCRRSITVTVFKVTGETNTDDLSPAPDAWSRPDIPLHALAMLKNAAPRHRRRRKTASAARSSSSRRCKRKGHLVAYVGDVVGTGSSRKSATNSRAVVHRRGHPLRAEQALRRRLPRRQDRADLLQHDGRRRRAADRARRVARWTWATWSSCAPTKARR